MVSINNSTRISQIESNIRYLIELDISEDASYEDYLGMAFYYHYLHENRVPGVNYSRLYNWCRSFCYDAIKNRNISRIRDNHIAASILVFSSIKDGDGFDKQKEDEIKNEIPKLLEEEMLGREIFFDSPNHTAIILYSLRRVGIVIQNQDKILDNLLRRYLNQNTFNNLLGLKFLIALLLSLHKKSETDTLVKIAESKLEDQLLNYEDKLYILSSVWQYYEKEDKSLLLRLVDYFKELTENNPILLADLINRGDISEITLKEDSKKISRLYKATMLDMICRYNKHLNSISEQELDKRYAGDFGLKWGAFLFYSLLSIIPSIILIKLYNNLFFLAYDFWINRNPSYSWSLILFSTFVLVLFTFLAYLAVVIIFSLFTSLIRKKISKDLRVVKKVIHNVFITSKLFICVFVFGVIIVALLQIFLQGAIEHKLEQDKKILEQSKKVDKI